MIEALVFDLDDTLYSERDFAMSGYRAVAQYLADSGDCDFQTALSCMAKTFVAEGRQRVFPALLEQLSNTSKTLPDLVEIYRQHNPAICLFPGYTKLLAGLARQYRLGVITDGLPAVQARKVRALGLDCVMDKIIYTWAHGADKEKPHPFSFNLMLEYLETDPGSVLFVGDNAEKDCRGAHRAGMKCAHIRRPWTSRPHTRAITREAPEFAIETLLQLPQILQCLNGD
jgi:putative hydrolase of the HAD superfamily